MITVTFIVPVLHGEFLNRTIDSIYAQISIELFEVIIVNNGVDEKIGRIIVKIQEKYPSLIVVFCEKKGAASARNFGVNYARGKFLAFIDSDVILDKNWAHAIIGNLSDFYDCGAGPIIPIASETNRWLHKYRYKFRKVTTSDTFILGFPGKNLLHTISFLNTAACIVRTSSFKRLKGFDENLLRLEDNEFSYRAYLNSMSFFYTDKVRAEVFYGGNMLQYCLRSAKDGYYLAILWHKSYFISPQKAHVSIRKYLERNEYLFYLFLKWCHFIGYSFYFLEGILKKRRYLYIKDFQHKKNPLLKLLIFSSGARKFCLNGLTKIISFDVKSDLWVLMITPTISEKIKFQCDLIPHDKFHEIISDGKFSLSEKNDNMIGVHFIQLTSQIPTSIRS